ADRAAQRLDALAAACDQRRPLLARRASGLLDTQRAALDQRWPALAHHAGGLLGCGRGCDQRCLGPLQPAWPAATPHPEQHTGNSGKAHAQSASDHDPTLLLLALILTIFFCDALFTLMFKVVVLHN